MKSVGTLIKEMRTSKRISRARLARGTKIREDFIEFLENEKWNKLPEYPITAGFVKNIAGYLGLDERKAIAILRRDFPGKSLDINPKPEITDRVVWGPKTTFILTLSLIIFVMGGYLLYQYAKFVHPPTVRIDSPVDNQEVRGSVLEVEGYVDPESALVVNNQPILIGDDGNFRSEIPIFEGTKEVTFSAKSRAGKETVIVRQIRHVK